ncbi:hypothetical protein RQP46_004583 [Phenoliferia psychrophenolica]
MFSSIFETISEFLPTAHAEEQAAVDEPEPAAESDVADAPAAEEEEEEEPEDLAPGIREACENSKACHGFKHHFEECAERVTSGKVQLPGENCVEELFHMMHCVDECAAPKVFAVLK